MRQIRLLQPFGSSNKGDVIFAYPYSAEKLIASGVAEEILADGNIENDSGSESVGIDRVGESDTLPPDEGTTITTDNDNGVNSRSIKGRGRVESNFTGVYI